MRFFSCLFLFLRVMVRLINIQHFQQFDNLELIAKEVVEGFVTGLHRSPFHGFSVEFAEHRLYNSGESTRHIDWKLFGRTEKLFVKQYEEETNLRCHLVLDTSSSMLFPYSAPGKGKAVLDNKLAFSVYSAAALFYLMRRQRDAVGLTTFTDRINFHVDPRISSVHSEIIYGKLRGFLFPSKKDLKKGTDAVSVLHQIAEQIHKRSLVIIFSDMFSGSNHDQLFGALQHLRNNKHEVILFHVTDSQKEKEFDFVNRPCRFVDLETGEEARFNPHDVKEAYRKGIDDYFHQLSIKCGQYNIDLVEADISNSFNDILWAYLIKRKRLF